MAEKEKVSRETYKIYQAYNTTFSTISGMIVLQDLEKSYNMQPSYVADNSYETAHNEGKRHVYLVIKKILNWVRNGELIIMEDIDDDRASDSE